MSSFYLLFIRLVIIGVVFFELPKTYYMIEHVPECGTPFCYRFVKEYKLMPQFGGETVLKSGGMWLFLHEVVSIGLVVSTGLYIVGRMDDRVAASLHFAHIFLTLVNAPHLVTASPIVAVLINLLVVGLMFRWLNQDGIKKYFVLVSSPVWMFDYFAFFGFVISGKFTHEILTLIG